MSGHEKDVIGNWIIIMLVVELISLLYFTMIHLQIEHNANKPWKEANTSCNVPSYGTQGLSELRTEMK